MAFIAQQNPADAIQASIQQTAEQAAQTVKWVLIVGVVIVLLYLATKK